MPIAPEDQPLYAAVTASPPTTIAGVIAVMQQIDAVLPDSDGLKWFNRLYLAVTREVDLHPPAGGWQDPTWLLGLDVIFAGFYFNAVASYLNADPATPSSWRALLDQRRTPGIDRIQFALGGMNAHINHDLALALLATDAQQHVIPNATSPQHADYEAVNALLKTVMPSALATLAIDPLGDLAQDTGKIGRLLAFWDLCKARDLAWDFATHLHMLHGLPRTVALRVQDQMTGVLGRAILAFA
jgi:Family of unknown function (DUF5995)